MYQYLVRRLVALALPVVSVMVLGGLPMLAEQPFQVMPVPVQSVVPPELVPFLPLLLARGATIDYAHPLAIVMGTADNPVQVTLWPALFFRIPRSGSGPNTPSSLILFACKTSRALGALPAGTYVVEWSSSTATVRYLGQTPIGAPSLTVAAELTFPGMTAYATQTVTQTRPGTGQPGYQIFAVVESSSKECLDARGNWYNCGSDCKIDLGIWAHTWEWDYSR